MIHLPRSSYTKKPWKNGLGMTEEILVYPENHEDFIFRISMAKLSSSGPFSEFPGIDRSLILLEGKPILLNGKSIPLLTPVTFAGEEKTTAIVEGEGRDLNLMCRRGKASGRILTGDAARSPKALEDLSLIFFLGNGVLDDHVMMKKFDSLLLNPGETMGNFHGENILRLDVSPEVKPA